MVDLDSGVHFDLFKSTSTSPSRLGKLIELPAFLQGGVFALFSGRSFKSKLLKGS